MGQKEKLIQKLKSRPKDFSFQEAETLLGYLSYQRSDKGRTSGSRVIFYREGRASILLHKPHPLGVSGQAAAGGFGTGGIAVKNTMEYKGYVGSVEFSEEDKVLFGQVMGIRSLISYEGTTAEELVEDFHGAVDDYLKLCQAQGIEPERAYKGSFNVRISPELHRKAAICAAARNISLNSLVEQSLEKYVTA